MTKFTQYTFASALTTLAALLGDPANVYWSIYELKLYLRDALRTWGGLTNYWRERALLQLVPGVPFYDLSTPATEQLGYNITDQEIYQRILFMLLEPSDDVTVSYTGSEQFSYDSITSAIQRRRDQFLIDTGIVLTRTPNYPTLYPPVPRLQLPAHTTDVRRVAWTDRDGVTTPVERDDEFAISNYDPLFLAYQPGRPVIYSVAETAPLELSVAPPPLDGGTFDLITVETGGRVDPALGVQSIGIPDNYTWAVTFGALAELLSQDSTARDTGRAEYCEGRYQQAVAIAKDRHTSVVNAELNGRSIQILSLSEADSLNYRWQSQPGTPAMIGLAGHSLLFSFPPPDAKRPYMLAIDVIRNAPNPKVVLDDYIQTSSAEYQAILDYSRHLACFKMGGTEFENTQTLYQNFISLASNYNSRLKASVTDLDAMTGHAKKDAEEIVRSR